MHGKKGAEFFFKGKMYWCPAGVYFPSEDSYFLAENVKVKPGAVVADVGCGSGIQALNALMLGASMVYSLDINPEAAEAAEANCKKAGFTKKIKAAESDLFGGLHRKADCIIFNTPYVESERIRFLQTDHNGFAQTENKLAKMGFAAEIAARRRGFFEELVVYRCRKAPHRSQL